ncbi:hypothetical protein M408DRAFT_61343 [Serendipita vermifera MAFF 305830]|uniref:Peptide N-acetyl-beta-D-glucosaminyl asparaginase amidase A N-terminal domain-containing protein n=1 Tax=Serendipita vermifera MAFF 305830 TaxID=933852 RepID=A0A0C3B8K3_SERVB|nr:hypothetical protein M408DRAFT_61343 [Serendipita vermifera MAFF 305830]
MALLYKFLTIVAAILLPVAAQNTTNPFVNFQVSQPLTLPKNVHTCQVELIHRTFGNSYYLPEVVQYTPPIDCGSIGSWAGISLNWTATSNGTQYDRLAGVTLQNVEIWRTSTSEPTLKGIIWTALKDVSKYLPLFSKPGTLIVDLNNIVDPGSGLTGEFDVTLTATFYRSDWAHPKQPSADLILPLSTLKADQSNVFTAPPVGNTTISLPRHAVSAVVEIQATGNFQDEFWYYNLPNEYLTYVPPDTTYGTSSFREIRLLVDGQIAGVVFPYPVLFTGAFVPTVWRPIVAYGAYDAPTYTVDLTPFIPLLTDGQEHVVSLDVVSDEPDHTIVPNWYLSGNIKVSLDSSGKQTTGNITRYEVPAFATSQHSVKSFSADSYNFTVNAGHSLVIESTIISGSGKETHVVWKQDLQFTNLQTYLNNATEILLTQNTRGISTSIHNNVPVITDSIDFPLSIDYVTSVSDEKGSGFSADFNHRYNRQYLPSPWEIRTDIHSAQRAWGTYITSPNQGFNRTANGTSENSFSYVDAKLNSYYRVVNSLNNTITKDQQGGSLTWDFWPLAVGWPGTVPESIVDSLPPFEVAHLPHRQIGP